MTTEAPNAGPTPNVPMPTRNQKGFLAPASWDEAMILAQWIKKTRFCPKDYADKENAELVIAFHMGARVGLDPLQSLQGIAVINGRPCLWGDHMRAIVMHSGLMANYSRYNDGKKAIWKFWRKDIEEAFVGEFTLEDANRAGLPQRSDAWRKYPVRMLDMRASAFALRNGFADVLQGFDIREEQEDYINTTAEPSMRMPTEIPADPEPPSKTAAPPSPADAGNAPPASETSEGPKTEGHARFQVNGAQFKDGKTNGKEWRLYRIEAGDSEKYYTFDKAFFEKALVAKQDGTVLAADWKLENNRKTLVTLAEAPVDDGN